MGEISKHQVVRAAAQARRRAVAHRTLESIHRVGIAFGGDFDAAVGQVADPPVDPFAHRRRFREEPESDALHAAADDISTRDAHLRIDPQVGRAFQAGLRREPPRSAESLALPVQPRATGTAPRCSYGCEVVIFSSTLSGSAFIGSSFCRCSS